MTRLVLLICLLLGPAFLTGLSSCEDYCGEPYSYRIEAYQVSLRRVEPQNPYKYPLDTLSAGQTVPYREIDLFLAGKEQPAVQTMGGANLWACSPVVTPADTIRELTVSSTQAYNASLPAGSDLKSVLSVGHGGYDHIAVTEALVNSAYRAESTVSLRFTQPPDQAAQHEFTIRIKLSRGPVFTLQTKPVTVAP